MYFLCLHYFSAVEQVFQHIEGTESHPGTGLMAKARVRVHFEDLREDLKLQEQAAMTAVDTHIRERLCSLRRTQQELTNSLAQVKYTLNFCIYFSYLKDLNQ